MSEYRRQHPLLVLLDTGRGLISNIGVALVIAVSLPSSTFGGFVGAFIVALLALFALSIVYNGLRWRFFFYRYEEGMVHIRQGILFKRERTIRRERVQSINVYANVVQQALGLRTLQIKTAGVGVDAEVNLRAVSKEEAERIRQHLNKEGKVQEGGLEEVAKALRALQGRDLWLAGLTSGRFMALFSVAAVALSQVIDYIPQSLIDQALARIPGVPLLLGLGVVLALFFATWALSTVVFALQFANFTVRRFEDRLELDWGVIKRSHVTVRLHRLQAVVVQQGLLRQPIGLCTLLVEVAGGGAKEQEKVSVLYPMLRMREVEGFLKDLLPEYRLPSGATRAPKRAMRRYLFRSTVPMALLVAALLVASYHWNVPYGWAALLLFVPTLLLGRSRHSNAKFSIDGDQLTIGFRSLGLYQVLIGREHVQSLSLLANPFQRLGRLRTLSISLLSSPAGKAYALKDLDASDAWAVREWYSMG